MKRIWQHVGEATSVDLNPSRSPARRLRRLIRWLRARGKAGFRQSDTDRLIREISTLAEQGDWHQATSSAIRWAERAEQSDDRALLERVGNDFRRLRRFEQSFALLTHCKRRMGQKEWNGSDPMGKCLLIERRDGDLATFFIFLSTIDLGIARGIRCIVLVEDRLIPLFKRTFPQVDIRSETLERATSLADADFVTSFEAVAHFLGWDGNQRRKLIPDPDEVTTLRRSYAASSDKPLVGIAWGSVNINKDAPGIQDWLQFLDRVPVRYVNLQYGDVAATVRRIERDSCHRILNDPSVNQLIDMDRFASQVSCLSAVITISNTVAHVAGALGVPTFVLLDGQFKRSWPGFGSDVPWYESVHLSRRNNSGWDDAFNETEKWLSAVI